MMAYHQRVPQYKSRIDFDDPSTTKPPSLAKSAVLQALEEEERQQSRGKGLKRVAWPPSFDGGDEYEQNQSQAQQHPQQPQQYYQQPSPQPQPATYQQQPQQQYQPYQQQQQQQQPHQHQQQQPHQPRERIIPIQRPEPSTQQPQYQPQATQAFQPLVPQQHQQQQLYQSPEAIPQLQFYQQPDQLPFITPLRKEAPMSQEPTPVYQTQPVAAIYQGGSNMRGDQKWPPAEYKKQSDLDNEERRKLAHEPAFRPRKVQKDYSNFFAKNALNQTYPGYRAPPGTQHHS